MILFLVGTLMIASSGLPGLFLSNDDRLGETLAEGLALLGGASTFAGLLQCTPGSSEALMRTSWNIPGGEILLAIDPISVIFLLPLLLVYTMTVIFGRDYWPQAQHPENSRKLRLFHGLIAAAMIFVFTAQNGLLFLFSWEVMALSSFFLITTEEHRLESRRAGFIYLVATHTSTLALFALFLLLESCTGSFSLPAAASLPASSLMTAIFLLSTFAFGLKAGIIPLHIWLPPAHAAAPSHVSALLSGVMIKTGIYGLVRITSLYEAPPQWWGWVFISLGLISSLLGVTYALAQHDLKRLLAYHSVENIGIITLGLGLALLGRSSGLDELTALGLAGALLHVINHALFKSLLFLCAGAVIHGTGRREIERMGGLIRTQPWVAFSFLGGAIAICGFPPFNGFISEWLIYQGSLRTIMDHRLSLNLAVLVIPVLALVGGLALACFVKAFATIFLGLSRFPEERMIQEAPWSMRSAILILLVTCLLIGLFPWGVTPLLDQAVVSWAPLNGDGVEFLQTPLLWMSLFNLLLVVAGSTVTLWWFRRRVIATREPTWGCAFACPTARMQYSASSFAASLVKIFRFGLWTQEHGGKVDGLFPKRTNFSTHTVDTVLDRLLLPTVHRMAIVTSWLRSRLQNGITSLYLFYVLSTLITLLILSGL